MGIKPLEFAIFFEGRSSLGLDNTKTVGPVVLLLVTTYVTLQDVFFMTGTWDMFFVEKNNGPFVGCFRYWISYPS